ncbi:hypothetical protein GCM10010266_42090 [Streptomyces griseomycini]|nr:hypothetical protein GCM10010266_42090 [Streptomyces griseomycini]
MGRRERHGATEGAEGVVAPTEAGGHVVAPALPGRTVDHADGPARNPWGAALPPVGTGAVPPLSHGPVECGVRAPAAAGPARARVFAAVARGHPARTDRPPPRTARTARGGDAPDRHPVPTDSDATGVHG